MKFAVKLSAVLALSLTVAACVTSRAPDAEDPMTEIETTSFLGVGLSSTPYTVEVDPETGEETEVQGETTITEQARNLLGAIPGGDIFVPFLPLLLPLAGKRGRRIGKRIVGKAKRLDVGGVLSEGAKFYGARDTEPDPKVAFVKLQEKGLKEGWLKIPELPTAGTPSDA